MSNKDQNQKSPSEKALKEVKEIRDKHAKDDLEMEEMTKTNTNQKQNTNEYRSTQPSYSEKTALKNEEISQKYHKERSESRSDKINLEKTEIIKKTDRKTREESDFKQRSYKPEGSQNKIEESKKASNQILQETIYEEDKLEELGKWKIASNSVQGKGHIQSGSPCQDSTSELIDINEDFYGLALADGAGSCKHSEKGSELITREILHYVKEKFDAIFDIENIEQSTIEKIYEYWSRKRGTSIKIHDLFSIFIKEEFDKSFSSNRVYQEIKKPFVKYIKDKFDKNIKVIQPNDNIIKQSFFSNIEKKFTEIFQIKNFDSWIEKIEKDFNRNSNITEPDYSRNGKKYFNFIEKIFDKNFSIEEIKHKEIKNSFLKDIQNEKNKILKKIREKHDQINGSFIQFINNKLKNISDLEEEYKINEEVNFKVKDRLKFLQQGIKEKYESDKKEFLEQIYKYNEMPFEKLNEDGIKVPLQNIKKEYDETWKKISEYYNKMETFINQHTNKISEKLQKQCQDAEYNILEKFIRFISLGFIKKLNIEAKIREYCIGAMCSIDNEISNESESFTYQIRQIFQNNSTIDKNCNAIGETLFRNINRKLHQVFDSVQNSHQFKQFFLNYIKQEFDKIFNIGRTYNKFREKFLLQHIEEKLNDYAKKKGYKFKDLSSTLLFIAVKKEQCIFGHIGDGVIGTMDNQDKLNVISLPENGEYANSTFFTTSTDYKDRLRIKTGTLTKTRGFILMSDGAGEGLYDIKKQSLVPLNGKIINYLKDYKSHEVKELLKNTLNRIKSEKTTDDCSIGIMRIKE